MSRPLHLPHSFGLVLFKTAVGYRIGYCLNGKRILPLFMQVAILIPFNKIMCALTGHEYLPKALMPNSYNCLHCGKHKICPDCNGTGTNYFVPSPMRGAKKDKSNTVPVTLFNCRTCGGLGRM
jgi:hypothetical protein